MAKPLRIKPHHLLDIIRDLGAGKKHEPHPYGHGVHRLARIIRDNPHTVFVLTADADSICEPCCNMIDRRCVDTTTSPGRKVSRESWNRLIDGRIFEKLGLEEGAAISALDFCRLASEMLGDLYTLYVEADPEKTAVREKNLTRGFEEYLKAAE